jgi:hypothetical protein
MNNTPAKIDKTMQAQIDRLVADELPEEERQNLLAWLDEDLNRWRSCALAFLEAQTWEAATAAWPEEQAEALERVVPMKLATLQHASKTATSRSVPVLGLALAGALALVFATGVVSGRFWPARELAIPPAIQPAGTSAKGLAASESAPLLATVSVRTNLDPHVAAQLQVPVTPVSAAAVQTPAFSEYERMQWERRGFELNEVRRYLPARLPDGREIILPIKKIEMKYRGTPVS